MKNILTIPVALFTLLFALDASAAVCIQVDENRDNLESGERTAILTMVESSARQRGLKISHDEDSCDEIFSIYSVRLGNTLTATLSTPDDVKSQKARDLDELPEAYDKLIAAVVSDKEQRENEAAQAQAAQEVASREQPVEADSSEAKSEPGEALETNIWFARLGYAMDFGLEFGGGPGIGVGYRYEASDFGLEISALNLNLASINSFADAMSASWLRVGGMYFFNPAGNQTPYLQTAMSWGSNFIHTNDEWFGSSGIRGEFGGGMEFLRESPVRMFVEANLVLPFYKVKYTTTTKTPNADNGVDVLEREHKLYTPALMIFMGVGF